MRADQVRVLEVVGGSRGLAASYERVRALADAYDAAGRRLREWADHGARTLADGDLLRSAPLAPLTFAEAEVAVLTATTGPDGLLVESTAWVADAVLVRATVAAFEATDELVAVTFEVADHALGRTVGFAVGAAAPGLLTAVVVLGPAAYVLHQSLPPHLQRRLEADLREGSGALADDVEAWLVAHPEAVQHLVSGGGGLLDGLWDGLTPLTPGGPFGVTTFTPDTEAAAAVLAGFYGDPGTGVAVPLDDGAGPAASPAPDAPTGLADLLTHLGRVGDRGDGAIEVHTLTGPDGQARHVVHLPGTDDMTTLPWTKDGDARDLATNFLLVSGGDNTYQQGILDAMSQAGIDPDEPVLLVGHSQGGMAAAAVLAGDSGYSVTDVVTAGAPTAHVDGFPPGSHVLSLEHRGDVVPLLDGEDNRDSPQQTTVHFDAPATGVVDHHALDRYVAAAGLLDSGAADPHGDPGSVADALARLRAAGYLDPAPGTSVEVRGFTVVREQEGGR